jgi:short-subunit dehydrogenase
LSLALRTEAVGHGVGVTVVCPSAVETPILDKGAFGSFRGRQFLLDAERTSKAYDADLLAADVLRAVARDEAILVVPARTRMGWRLSRLAPRLLNRMATRFVAEQRALGS